MKIFTAKSTVPLFRTALVGVLSLAVMISGLAGATDSTEEEQIQIVLTNEATSLESTIICSSQELEESLARYSRSTHVRIDNHRDVPTEKFLRLMEILKSLGFADVSSNGAGNPGWTLYPLPKDIDIFNCGPSEQDIAEKGANDSQQIAAMATGRFGARLLSRFLQCFLLSWATSAPAAWRQ